MLSRCDFFFIFSNLKTCGLYFFTNCTTPKCGYYGQCQLSVFVDETTTSKICLGCRKCPPNIFLRWNRESVEHYRSIFLNVPPHPVGTLFLKNVPPQSVPSNVINRVGTHIVVILLKSPPRTHRDVGEKKRHV